MEIHPPPNLSVRSATGASPTPVNPIELLARLQPGQTLLAKVENILINNDVELRIGNQSIRANSPVPLNAGQSINLVVEESNNGNILRIAQQANQADLIASALRAVLPKQQPVADVVKQLVQTLATIKTEIVNPQNTNSPAVNTQNASPTLNNLRTAIQTLVNNLPSVKTLSQAGGLQQAIKDSGINLESNLRQSIISGKPPTTSNDIKANFLRIAQTALQLQSKLDANVVNTALNTNPTSNTAAKTSTLESYSALLSAAAKQPPTLTTDKSILADRPLLPPLPSITPPSTSSESSISQRLLASLPPVLQRLFSSPPIVTPLQTSPTQAAQQSQQMSQQLFSTMLVELLNQMESGIARIQQHQLNSLAGDDMIRHILGLELPVFNGKGFDNIGVRIEWENRTDDESSRPYQWRVVLNFDFDDLGKTQAVIRAGKDEIHTDFKSENTLAQTLFQSHKEILEDGLRKHGLTPGNVTFSTGEIDVQPSHSQNDNLVKTKA